MVKQAVTLEQFRQKFCDWALETEQYRYVLSAATASVKGGTPSMDLSGTPLARQWDQEIDVIDPQSGLPASPSAFLSGHSGVMDGVSSSDLLEKIVAKKVAKNDPYALVDILSDAAHIAGLEKDLGQLPSLSKLMANHAVSNANPAQIEQARKRMMEMGDRQVELGLLNDRSSTCIRHGGGRLSEAWRRHVRPVISSVFGLRSGDNNPAANPGEYIAGGP